MLMKKFIFVLSGVVVAFIATAGINANRDVSVPYNMYVEPGTHSCLVTWEDDDNSAWNLRYRLFDEESGETILLNGLYGSSYTGSYGTAVTFPAPWGGTYTYSGNGVFYFRNNYYSSNTPGNITYTIPEGYTNATFTVKITSASNNYGSGNLAVATPQTAAVNQYFSAGTTKEWDVVASSGEKITITTTDNKYSFDITSIEVYTTKENEWTYVYDLVKKRYNIEGLEMETDYEVQVQAIGDDGTLSDWNRPDVFTTLDEEPIIPSVHIMGEIDDQVWAPDAGTKMEYNPATELYTATVHAEAEASFGFTLEIDDNGEGGWNYILPYRFGPESNGEFYLTEERLGQRLTLTFDNFSDVYVMTTGDYEITVSLEQRYIIIGKKEIEVLLGDVDGDGTVDVNDVTALINKILGYDVPVFIAANADIDGDGTFDVNDVSGIINIILTH